MRESKAQGSTAAPYLFVMLYPATEGMMAWFWRAVHGQGIKKSECRVVTMIDEPPMGRSNKPLATQFRAAKARFEREIAASKPHVVIPMGTEAFQALTGIRESILDARGYLIRKDLFKPVVREVYKQVGTYVNASKATGAKKGDPKMKNVKEAWSGPLGPDFAGTVIPAFTLDYIRLNQFAVAPAFHLDMDRARRCYEGRLHEWRLEQYFSEVDQLPEPETLGKLIAFDIETHGVDNEVIDLVSFSDGTVTAAIDWSESARLYMERLFALPGRLFVAHNSPFDVPRLMANGVRISKKVREKHLMDTMFGNVQIQPDLHKSLGRVAPVWLDLGPWKTSSRNKKSHWRAMVDADPRTYAAKDSFNTWGIASPMRTEMKDLGVWKYFMGRDGHPGPGVMATLPLLTEMSRKGIPIDKEEAARYAHKLERKLFRLMKLWVPRFPKVRFSSNPQLQKLLYKQWQLPIQRNEEDAVSVDELALVKLQAYVRENADSEEGHRWQSDERCTPRVFDLMLALRKTSKLLSTYVQPVMTSADPRVHPSYLPASKDDERGGKKMNSKGTTATGRLASYKPNIQNQPKEVRRLYVPERGHCFVQLDYKSAELFVLAGMSGDQKLLADLLSSDMHQKNADRLGISRKVAKNVTYASQYLAGPAKQSSMILEQEHIYVSAEDCLAISESIWGYYSDATAYKQTLVALCESQHYITNPFGRTRFFHSGKAPAAVDFIPQSVVADVLWCVLKRVADFVRKLGGRVVTTVHDSILLSVPPSKVSEAALGAKAIMETRFDCVAKDWYLPVEIEVGAPNGSWGSLKPYVQ